MALNEDEVDAIFAGLIVVAIVAVIIGLSVGL